MKWPLSLVDACLALIILFTISQIISLLYVHYINPFRKRGRNLRKVIEWVQRKEKEWKRRKLRCKLWEGVKMTIIITALMISVTILIMRVVLRINEVRENDNVNIEEDKYEN